MIVAVPPDVSVAVRVPFKPICGAVRLMESLAVIETLPEASEAVIPPVVIVMPDGAIVIVEFDAVSWTITPFGPYTSTAFGSMGGFQFLFPHGKKT
ncbi:hypothetical protein WL32_28250 [Burkholderia cepacia]|nr:hypothetical protein WL32_28250 [Burkholderia cepacia]